jgi:hypothetical protein
MERKRGAFKVKLGTMPIRVRFDHIADPRAVFWLP